MNDDFNLLDREIPRLFPETPSRKPQSSGRQGDGDEEESCPAFGFLRGLQARALTLEIRLRNGNREYYPYSWLGPWQYNPSVGLLLKYTGDTTSLVLICGSNLDALVGNGSMNLTDRGIARHRVTWLREMDEDELRRASPDEPTIDRITIAEFESGEELRAWVKKTSPAFIRAHCGNY